MYVNVVFVVRCLYSTVSLTLVKQLFIKNIYYYYYNAYASAYALYMLIFSTCSCACMWVYAHLCATFTCADEEGVGEELLTLHGFLTKLTSATEHHQHLASNHRHVLPPGGKCQPLQGGL